MWVEVIRSLFWDAEHLSIIDLCLHPFSNHTVYWQLSSHLEHVSLLQVFFTFFFIIKKNFYYKLCLWIHLWLSLSKSLFCFCSTVSKSTGCSLNIVFSPKILKYSGLWSFSVLPRWQCVYTHKAGRKPAELVEFRKIQNFKEKHNIQWTPCKLHMNLYIMFINSFCQWMNFCPWYMYIQI